MDMVASVARVFLAMQPGNGTPSYVEAACSLQFFNRPFPAHRQPSSQGVRLS